MLNETEPLAAAPDDRIAWGLREIAQALGIAIASLVFMLGVIAVVIAAAGLTLSDSRVLGVTLVANLFFELGIFALAAFFSVGKYRLRWRALGFRMLPLDRAWVIVATAMGTLAIVIVYGVIVDLLDLDKLLPEQSLPGDIFDNQALVITSGILVVLAAPLAEETFFRGFMFSGLVKRLGFFGAALASGLLFSLAHGQLATLIPFTLVGMLFAAAYAYTGSLWTNIGAHFIFNVIGFLVMLFSE